MDACDAVMLGEKPGGAAAESNPASHTTELLSSKYNEDLALEVEEWGLKLLKDDDGWVEAECNSMFRSAFNSDGRTRAYLQWMKDSRSGSEGTREYPCVKFTTTLDAPLETVCDYLSREGTMTDYNDLVVEHGDAESLSPCSKLCWGRSPQIMLIQPRELLTFCHYRWLEDGTQVIVNQACTKEEYDAHQEQAPPLPRAYAFRGATFLRRNDDDNTTTRMEIVTHASPGEDVPEWAMTAAVHVLIQVHPFKLSHRINEGVKALGPQTTDQHHRPAGISLMGFACFWRKSDLPGLATVTPQSSSSLSADSPPCDDDDDEEDDSSPCPSPVPTSKSLCGDAAQATATATATTAVPM